MSIELKLEGFDELLKQIQKAEGDVESASVQTLRKSADIMQNTLKAEMQKSNVSSSLINTMPAPKIEKDHGLITARVGWQKGAYNPSNPSAAYKVIFLNYGTPNRTKHGKIQQGGKVKLGFIKRAKSKSKKPIQIEQERMLKEILKGLK